MDAVTIDITTAEFIRANVERSVDRTAAIVTSARSTFTVVAHLVAFVTEVVLDYLAESSDTCARYRFAASTYGMTVVRSETGFTLGLYVRILVIRESVRI